MRENAKDKYTDILHEDQMTIFLSIPKNTYKLEVTAKCINEETEEKFEAITSLSLSEIIENRLHELDWEEENVKYVINEECLNLLNE